MASTTSQVTQTQTKNEKQVTKEPTPWNKMSSNEKLMYLISNITVEPLLVCYIMPSVLASLATQNLNLEKACRVNLGYDDEVCNALTARNTSNYTKQESEVQQMVANMIIWKTILQSSLPAILILFMGSWSDRRSCRKPFMLLPIVGEFFTSVGLIICTYFFYELPMEVAGIVEAIFPAMTGGWFAMFMAIFSYVADITTPDVRTLRIGVVNVCFSLGIPFGMALSGVLYKQIGFYGIFSISASLYVLSFMYGYLRINEKKKLNTVIHSEEKNTMCCSFIRDFFDLKHISNTFRVAFKHGEDNRKIKVSLLMVMICVIIGPMHGEMAVAYLFMRYRFGWNEVNFSVFATYSMVTNLIGTIVSVGLFSHILRVDDSMIGMFSCASKILSSFVYAFATTTWGIYMAPIVEILNGTSFIAMRSMASKLVPTDELGKVNSLFGICEALMPLIYGPLYSAVYASTMHTFPGAFFVLGGAMTTPAFLIFMWFYNESRKEKCKEKSLENKIKDEIIPVYNICSIAEKSKDKHNLSGVNNSAFEVETDLVNKNNSIDEQSRL